MVIIEIIEILMLDKPLSESSQFRDECGLCGAENGKKIM